MPMVKARNTKPSKIIDPIPHLGVDDRVDRSSISLLALISGESLMSGGSADVILAAGSLTDWKYNILMKKYNIDRF